MTVSTAAIEASLGVPLSNFKAPFFLLATGGSNYTVQSNFFTPTAPPVVGAAANLTLTPTLSFNTVGTTAAESATVTGNAYHVVVIQSNPGYGPSPSQTGTGTIVAIVC